MTGSSVTFDFSFDGSTWVDVVETDGTAVSTQLLQEMYWTVDPSGWAFATAGSLELHQAELKQLIEKYNLYLKLVYEAL